MGCLLYTQLSVSFVLGMFMVNTFICLLLTVKCVNCSVGF